MSQPDGPQPERLFQIFLDLVKIDSESGREGKVRDYIREFCTALNFAVHEDGAAAATGGDSGNLVVRVPAGAFSPLPPVMFCAHMDTVSPGKAVIPFDAGDRFISISETILGADCKAAVAAILAVVEHLAEVGGPYRALELVFTVQEEPGLIGARHMDMSLIDCEWGIVMDGSGPVGGIVIQAPSQDKFKFVVKGRAAHAGVEPEKGINAIGCAAQAIAGLKLGRLDEVTTVNVGLISGGEAVNIVPETVEVEGEIRSHSDSRLDEERRRVVESFEAAAGDWSCELEAVVERTFERFKLDPRSTPVLYLAAALKSCGFEPVLTASGGGSDANVMNGQGLPVAVLNIGLVNAHSKEEFIMKEELHGLSRVITRLAFLAGGEGREAGR
ncbi:MAG: M20/M25/M40 family metallo-hydrolase [Candidatus Geothermincolia bacterium]